MPAIQRELRMLVSHFQIGDYIEYGWFRGEIIGLNCNQLQHLVRVVEVLRTAANRSCGSVQRVPFNLGREHKRPEERNRCHEQSQQDQAQSQIAAQKCNSSFQGESARFLASEESSGSSKGA